MSDNKVLATLVIAAFCAMGLMTIMGNVEKMKQEEEKTKQLDIHLRLKQLQVDSIRASKGQ